MLPARSRLLGNLAWSDPPALAGSSRPGRKVTVPGWGNPILPARSRLLGNPAWSDPPALAGSSNRERKAAGPGRGDPADRSRPGRLDRQEARLKRTKE